MLVLLLLLAWPSRLSAGWQECNSQGLFPGLYGNQVVANLTAFRTGLLDGVWQSFNPEAPYLEGAAQFNPVAAFAACPPTRKLQQYGSSSSSNSSSWQFCSLSRLPPPCIVYSIGPPGVYTFEQAVLKATKCNVFTFDCSSEGKSIDQARHQHHKLCIGLTNSTTNSSTGQQQATAHVPVAEQGRAPLGATMKQLLHLRGVDAAAVSLSGEQLLEFLSHLKVSMPLPRQLSFVLPLQHYKQREQHLRNAPAELALVMQHLTGLGYAATHTKVDSARLSAAYSFLLVERVAPYSASRAAQVSRAAARANTFEAEQEAALAALPKAKRLVVSMSSFPGRAQYANPSVYSIMRGLRKPDAFYFWIAMNVSRFGANDAEVNGWKNMPDEVKGLLNQFPGKVLVKVTKDYGPATKLLPTLQEEKDPDTIIITVDDDTYYRPDTVLALEQEMLRRPGHAIVRSCEITHWDPEKEPPKKGWRHWKLDAGMCRGFQTAFASAAYRREFFDDLVFDQERAPKGCLHHDDMWFGAHLWLRNVPIWVLPGFGVETECDKTPGRCWPVMYHRPKNRMSISTHAQADQWGYECLDFFKWMDDNELRKKMLADRALKPYKPFD